MDSLFQVKDIFFKEMDKLIAKNEFIACNEEPVGLKEKWISNGFFSQPVNPWLLLPRRVQHLLDPITPSALADG